MPTITIKIMHKGQANNNKRQNKSTLKTMRRTKIKKRTKTKIKGHQRLNRVQNFRIKD